MATACSPHMLLLVVSLVSVLELTGASVQRITHRENTQVMMSYSRPKTYPCMADWNKVCEKDSDCCSGVCLAMFCKIEGVEKPTTLRPRRRLKLKGKGKGKGAPVDHSGRGPAQNRLRKKKVQ